MTLMNILCFYFSIIHEIINNLYFEYEINHYDSTSQTIYVLIKKMIYLYINIYINVN
jgi:hypothetical protein